MSESLLSSSSSSSPLRRSVTLNVGQIEEYIEGITQGYLLRIEVTEAVGLTTDIFVFSRQSIAQGEAPNDEFSNVASPADIEEYPVDEPETGSPYFRTNVVEVVYRDLELLESNLLDLKRDICQLLETLAQMDTLVSEVVVIDDSCANIGTDPCPPSPPTTARLIGALVDPTVDDDAEAGFGIGSIWTNVSTEETFVLIDSTNGAAVWLLFVGVAVKNNFTATIDPTPTDDSSENYVAGSHWFNVTSEALFVCVDNTEGAAVWVGGNTDAVSSVFARTGAVTAQSGDYTHAQTSGQGTDDHHAEDHAARHQNGGADEVSVAGLSGELADDQPPKDHASAHDAGGGDAMAIDAAAGTGSLRTLGTGAQQAAAGDDSRLSDARTPTAHAPTHASGGGDELTSAMLLEAQIKRIQESAGPTSLLVGQIDDAEYLARVGTAIVGRNPIPQTGFENQTDTDAAAMNGANLEIAPLVSTFNVYSGGKKIVISGTLQWAISTDLATHFCTIDSSGVAQVATTDWSLLSDDILVATVYKDGANYDVIDERHFATRSQRWHNEHHHTVGTTYQDGLTASFLDASFSIAQGVIFDEDIEFDTGGAKTDCTLWLRTPAVTPVAMTFTPNVDVPYLDTVGDGSGILQWDDDGTPTNAGANKYVANYVYARNSDPRAIAVVVGQAEFTTPAGAEQAALPSILLDVAEWKLLYRNVYRNVGGTATYISAQDFRRVTTGQAADATALSHAATTARDAANSHPADAITNTPAGAIAATDVQAAIDELDAEKQAIVVTQDVNQVAHGFTVPGAGDLTEVTVVRHNGTAWTRAQADSAANAGDVWVVTAVAGVDDFTIQKVGSVDITNWGMSANTVYFLSPSAAGQVTASKTTTATEVQLPVAHAHTVTAGEVLDLIGAVVGTALIPVVDSGALVKGSGDPTKFMRIEVDGLTTGTTRVLTMPDADITPDDVGDPRDPNAHAASHKDGGSDELDVEELASAGGADTFPRADGAGAVTMTGITHAETTGQGVDDHHAQAHATEHEPTGGDAMTVDAVAGTGSLRTLGTGAQQAAAGDDSRLSDARTPTAHAASHNAGGGDAMAIDAAAGTGSLRTIGTGALTAAAGDDSRLSDSRAPNGTASGDLNGSYPNPSVDDGADATAIHDNVSAEISVVAEKVAPVNADLVIIEDSENSNIKKRVQVGNLPAGGGGDTLPIVDTTAVVKGSADPSKLVRIEADGLTTATTRVLTMPDKDVTIDDDGDSRPPTAHASAHDAGGGDAMAIDAAAGTGSLRTLGTGATTAAAGNDSRLSDARTPTSHASSHDAGGGDAMAIDAVAGTGSLRTLGTGAQQAAGGTDSRLSDARTPTSHATSHTNGTDDIQDASATQKGLVSTGAQEFDGDKTFDNNVIVEGQLYSEEQATVTPTGTTQTIDWHNGNSITVDLGSATGDVTLTLNNPQGGASYLIKFIQGATVRDVVLPSTVLTPGGGAPTTLNITEVDDAEDVLVLYYDGVNYLANFTQNYG